MVKKISYTLWFFFIPKNMRLFTFFYSSDKYSVDDFILLVAFGFVYCTKYCPHTLSEVLFVNTIPLTRDHCKTNIIKEDG